MAMGLPVVTFDTPVSREYLGEIGIYAAFGSVHELAAGCGWPWSSASGRRGWARWARTGGARGVVGPHRAADRRDLRRGAGRAARYGRLGRGAAR
jgi:hypothetical protein